MQTILGSGGSIGKFLAKELSQFDNNIRLVSRNPKKINDSDQLVVADLTNAQAVLNAVEGSDVVYLLVGIPYKADIWEAIWPRIMKNVINACIRHQSKLVFFDNVYMYGKVNGWMKEDTPINPISRKGEVRRKIAEQLLTEIDLGHIEALIARSADFYGPEAYNTLTYITLFQRLKEGKKPQWMINPKLKHSFTYTPDAAKGTALLGNTPSAYGKVWHLPTDNNVLT
jgi:nucleoside-diphosphate-sugar epimerase